MEKIEIYAAILTPIIIIGTFIIFYLSYKKGK